MKLVFLLIGFLTVLFVGLLIYNKKVDMKRVGVKNPLYAIIGVALLALAGWWAYGRWTTSTPSAQAKITPVEFEVVSPPVGKWSDKIPTLHGEMFLPHGPILFQTDNFQVIELDDVAVKKNAAPIVRTAW